MSILNKYKDEILFGSFIVLFFLGFLFTYPVTLPFIIGLLGAFWVSPAIKVIQKAVKSFDLAVTIFLATLVTLILLTSTLTVSFINRDFKRLNKSFVTLANNNQDKIDETSQKVKKYLGSLYDFEALEKEIGLTKDSLLANGTAAVDLDQIDTDAIKDGFNSVVSFFSSSNEGEKKESQSASIVLILFSSLLYFVLILYQFKYFENLSDQYFKRKTNDRLAIVIDDFNNSFLKYFKLRSKIVLVLALMYFTTFLILDIPGMLLILALIIILAYIPYLHYLTLIPLAMGCLVVSVENDQNFLIPFGIIVGVFVFSSLIEELVLNPKIMEKNIGMNPVIMVLALSVWSFIFGLPGLLLGIPLTSLIIIYIKRYFLTSYNKLNPS